VLLPRADIAGDDLVEGLKELGAEVHQVTAYRTVPADEAGTEARQMLLRGEIDVITFTSASTVNNLVAVLGQEWKAIERTKLACIGPNTAAALSRKGLKVDMLAGESTIEGLVQAMESYFQAERRE